MAALTLLGVASARAGPPRSARITVRQTDRHLTATWTLPPGVDPEVIEIATAPSTGTDGHFFEENLEGVDVLRKGQTSYFGSEELGLGTYWVHIQTLDNDCPHVENSPCLAWSNIASLTIRLDANARPALRLVRGHPHFQQAPVTACDDTDGRLTFRTTLAVNPFRHGRAPRRGADSPLTKAACTPRRTQR